MTTLNIAACCASLTGISAGQRRNGQVVLAAVYLYGFGGWSLGKQSWEELAEDLMATRRQTVQAKDLGPGTERHQTPTPTEDPIRGPGWMASAGPSCVVPEVLRRRQPRVE